MRAIEDQSAEEAMRLIQKISSLQTDLAAATRRATIAEEMLAGTKSEGERAVEDAERWRLEAARVEACRENSLAAAALCEWVDAVRGGARADIAKVTPQPIKGIMPGFQSA